MVDDNKQLKKLSHAEMTDLLAQSRDALKESDFDATSVQATLNSLLETTGQKPGILFSLIRLAVSWAPFSPALNDTLATLGKEAVLTRLEKAIETAASN
jgi:glutamyl-tRNA synthetase